MAIGLYAKTGWVVAKEFELSPVYQIIVKHQWKPSITNQMQKNVNEVLAQGKLPTYGTSIDQVVPQYSIVGAFGLCRKCVCLGRGDAKQFSAKTRKPENAKTDRKTRKPRKRENRENGTFIQ